MLFNPLSISQQVFFTVLLRTGNYKTGLELIKQQNYQSRVKIQRKGLALA